MVEVTTKEEILTNPENDRSTRSNSFLDFSLFQSKELEKIRSSFIFSYLFREFKFLFLSSVVISFVFEILSKLSEVYFAKIISSAPTYDLRNQKSNVAIFIIILGISYFFEFLKTLVINKIENDSFYFIKKTIIKKFLGLKIEDKVLKKADVSMINEEEAWTIAEKWNHIAVHFSSSIFKIFSLFLIPETRNTILNAGKVGIFSSFSFIVLSSFLNFYFFGMLDKKRESLRIPVKEEAYLTEKEVSKAILIDNMGLKNSYLFKRDQVVKDLNNRYYDLEFLSISFLGILNFACESYPLLILAFFFFSSSKESMYFLTAFRTTLEAFNSLAGCYRDVKILNFSLGVADKFLSTVSKNDNELGAKMLDKEITSIDFENVSFSYENSEENIISSYSKNFVKSKVNKIEGKNGTGKSTILYLILGTIESNSGRIIIRTESGDSFDINKDINLVDWKENVVAYVSHENLFENDEGSTGQKQTMNIDQVISEKKSAKIFLFDEADNSLDENNKDLFYKKVNELVSNNKIVILISH